MLPHSSCVLNESCYGSSGTELPSRKHDVVFYNIRQEGRGGGGRGKGRGKKVLWLLKLNVNKNIQTSVVLCVFMGSQISKAALFLQLTCGCTWHKLMHLRSNSSKWGLVFAVPWSAACRWALWHRGLVLACLGFRVHQRGCEASL